MISAPKTLCRPPVACFRRIPTASQSGQWNKLEQFVHTRAATKTFGKGFWPLLTWWSTIAAWNRAKAFQKGHLLSNTVFRKGWRKGNQHNQPPKQGEVWGTFQIAGFQARQVAAEHSTGLGWKNSQQLLMIISFDIHHCRNHSWRIRHLHVEQRLAGLQVEVHVFIF